jgi:hypothetical protein
MPLTPPSPVVQALARSSQEESNQEQEETGAEPKLGDSGFASGQFGDVAAPQFEFLLVTPPNTRSGSLDTGARQGPGTFTASLQPPPEETNDAEDADGDSNIIAYGADAVVAADVGAKSPVLHRVASGVSISVTDDAEEQDGDSGSFELDDGAAQALVSDHEEDWPKAADSDTDSETIEISDTVAPLLPKRTAVELE